MKKPLTVALVAFACGISLFGLARAQDGDDTARASLSNSKQLALAAIMYAQDYDEMYPYGKTTAAIKPKVMPYLKNKAIFVDPTSGKDFAYNANMSAMALARMKNPAGTVLFHSPVAHTDGKFTIAYADGHCKREGKVPSLKVDSDPIKKVPAKSTTPAKKKHK